MADATAAVDDNATGANTAYRSTKAKESFLLEEGDKC